MTTEKREVYFEIINNLCGLYSVKSYHHREMLHSPMMDALWQCRDNLQHRSPDEDEVKKLITAAKAKLANLDAFGNADFTYSKLQ